MKRPYVRPWVREPEPSDNCQTCGLAMFQHEQGATTCAAVLILAEAYRRMATIPRRHPPLAPNP